MGSPSVIQFPSGYQDLGRISTSFIYRRKGTSIYEAGPQ